MNNFLKKQKRQLPKAACSLPVPSVSASADLCGGRAYQSLQLRHNMMNDYVQSFSSCDDTDLSSVFATAICRMKYMHGWTAQA